MPKIYYYDCRKKKENPDTIVRWCRKNFGQKGLGWDFYYNRGNVIIELTNPKFITIYELWHK